MEFLFTDKGAFIEALIILFCLSSILIIALYDGYVFLKRFLSVFGKPVFHGSLSKDAGETKEASQVTKPIIDDTNQDRPLEETIANDNPSPDAIYEEYVALVDETHEEIIERKEEIQKIEENIEKKTVLPEEKLPNNEEEIKQMENSGDIPEDTTKEENTPLEDKAPSLNKEEITNNEDSVTHEPTVDHDTSESKESIGEKTTDMITQQDEGSEEGKEATIDTTNESQEDSLAPKDNTDTSSGEQGTIETKETNNKVPENVTTTDLTPQNNHDTLYTLINTVKTLIARGQTLEARTLIIQGLALEKNNKELNLLLGNLYETERQFEKAEYVYKDLALEHPNDIEILEKLGNVLIIEKRYSIGLEIYKKILEIGGETEGTLYILSHLCHELGDASEGYTFMKKYLKQWPNNPEILSLLSDAEIELGKRKDAIETLKRLKNLTPYNAEITSMLQKLMMEEELAGNFSSQDIKN